MEMPTLPPSEALIAKQGHSMPTLPPTEALTAKQGHSVLQLGTDGDCKSLSAVSVGQCGKVADTGGIARP